MHTLVRPNDNHTENVKKGFEFVGALKTFLQKNVITTIASLDTF